MTNELTVFKTANLPTVDKLSKSLKSVDVGAASGVILKMDKTGAFVYGADQTEVEEGSEWAVNPYSICHGYIAWGKAEVLGEKMVPVTEDLPDHGPAPQGAEKGWQFQIGLALKCISGEDKDLEVRYSATSHGGKKAVQALGLAIAEQVDKDPSRPVPIVTLTADSYHHKQYGKVFTPEFTIVRFVDMHGNAEPVQETAAETTTRRRRRTA